MIKVRFAPSPTGYLHVGGARTALFNWLFARKNGGKFVLRIEDTDPERSKKEYEELIIQDLKWLGIGWDEGPIRQSARLHIYREYAQKLLDEGKAYYCFCSPEELERERKKAIAEGKPYKYSGKCRNIPPEKAKKRVESGEPASIRFKMSDEEFSYEDLIRGEVKFDLSLFGDFVIMRSNGLPSYNFAVVIDDHDMEITHVIRGEDHISNTPKQIKIYEALGWKPPEFAHLPMVLGPDRSRLSKRHGATAVFQFREEGILPEALFNYLALLGWSCGEKEIMTKEEMVECFELSRVSKAGAVFDYQKLMWMNHKHMERLSIEELVDKFEKYAGTKFRRDFLAFALSKLREEAYTLKELQNALLRELNYSPQEKITKEELKVIKAIEEKLEQGKNLAQAIKETSKELGIRGKALYHPLRIALTGRGSGPDLSFLAQLIEKASSLGYTISPLERLKKYEEWSLKE